MVRRRKWGVVKAESGEEAEAGSGGNGEWCSLWWFMVARGGRGILFAGVHPV